MWRPEAWTSSGYACAQLRHPARHRVLRPPDRTHRQGRPFGHRAAVCLPAGAPPAQGDRKGNAANTCRGPIAHGRGRQRTAGREILRFHHRRARRSGHRAVPPAGRGLRTRARCPDGRHCRSAGVAIPRRRRVPMAPEPPPKRPERKERSERRGYPKRQGIQEHPPHTASPWGRGTRPVRAPSSAPLPTRGVCTAATSATSPSGRTSHWWSCRPNCPARHSKSLKTPASRAC